MTTTVTNRRHGLTPGAVYIGRPSIFGNPFTVKGKRSRYAVTECATAEEALEKYERHVRGNPSLLAKVKKLRGRVLECWCKPAPCHGDVLARIADEQPAPCPECGGLVGGTLWEPTCATCGTTGVRP